MTKKPQVTDVVEEIYQSVLAATKKKRQLRSSTFWHQFKMKNRTEERIKEVKEALEKRHLMISIDDAELGKEDKDDWIKIVVVEPPPVITNPDPPGDPVPTPSDDWFLSMEQRVFESEKEVEFYFIMPLLEKLGYIEDDFAIGYPVQMYEGVKHVTKEADVVVFNGVNRSKENALLVVEAKRYNKIMTDDAVGQARAYSLWLSPPYFMVANGGEIRVYIFRGAVQSDVLIISLKRSDLRNGWNNLYKTLNKAAVIERKSMLGDILSKMS